MKKLHTFFALLLCLCLTLSLLSGCGDAEPTKNEPTPEPTAEPSPVPTPEPTPEPLDAAKLYREASESLRAAANLSAQYTVEQKITLPDYSGEELSALTLTELTTRSADYEALGGEGFRAVVHDTVQIAGKNKLEQAQVYADGILFTETDGGKYYSKLETEAFLAEQLPLTLLDEALYESAEAEETADGFSLRFAAASEAESWAIPADGVLQEASGAALLSPEGGLLSESYCLSYRFGGMTVTTSWEASYQAPEELDLSESVPENTKKRESLDDAFAPMILQKALVLMKEAGAAQVSTTANYYCEAGAQSVRIYDEFSLLDRESGYITHEEISYNAVDYAKQQAYSYSNEMDFEKGTLTVTYDDGETESIPQITALFREETRSGLRKYMPTGGDLVDAERKEVGDYWLIRFSGNGDYGVQVKDAVLKTLFSDGWEILDDMASAYLTKTAEGFLAVEKVSGIPTAFNLSFVGLHTVEGDNYELDLELNMEMSLFTDSACGELLDEPLSGPEPENKPTPVFYEVSDSEGRRMYLFGTIHVGDDRTAWLPQVIYDAFDASDALAVEFDTDRFYEGLDDDDELRSRLVQYYYFIDGTSVQNHIDSELYKQALELMQVSGNYNDTAESLRPYLWGNAVELFYLSQGRTLSSDKGVDNRLMARARETEKEILDVESGEFQISMIGDFSDELQELLLEELVEASRTEYLDGTLELYEAWCEGDEAALIEELAEMDEEERAELDEDELALYDEYHRVMELDRNANMAEVAKGYLESGKTVFFAVGLAHLLGEGGLVQTLRDMGFTVTLIDTH